MYRIIKCKWTLALGLLLLLSCAKESKEPIVTPPSYADAAEARVAVEALSLLGVSDLYLSTDDKAGLPLAWGAYLSGLVESEASEGYYPDLHDQKLSSPDVMELSRRIYNACFVTVEQANKIVETLPNTTGLDASEREQLLAEARFHRAWVRFYLVKTFGAHPEARGSQSHLSLGDAYALVVRDLHQAIAQLPQKSFAENGSRLTAFVARALLGEVYLHMSGYPLQESRYKEAVAVLRPIIQSGKHRLAGNGRDEEHSAYNTLRTTFGDPEYLYVLRGDVTASRASFAFPERARAWENVKVQVHFNPFIPTRLLMSVYREDDLRGKDRQFFHSFFKVSEGNKTIFEVFDPAPYFWLSEGAEASNSKSSAIGVYRYAEVLLMAAESIVQSQGVTREAVGYLAEVRCRAVSTPRAELEQALSSLTVKDFLEELYLERLRELPLEMKQYSDIVRTQLYPALQDDAIVFLPLGEAKIPKGRNLSPSSFYLPLPTF